MGRNFIVFDEKSRTMTSWKGLYKLRIRESEKFKTVLELYDLEIHQKKLGPENHRLKNYGEEKNRAGSSKEEFLGPQVEILKRNAVVKNQGTKTACTKNSWRLLTMGNQRAVCERRQLKFPPRYE